MRVWRNGRRTGLKIPGLRDVRVRVPRPVLNSDGNKIANQTKSICVNAIAVRSREGMKLQMEVGTTTGLARVKKSEEHTDCAVQYKKYEIVSTED